MKNLFREETRLGKINFSIIGCGKIGERHARHANDIGQLNAVCDIKEDRAEKLANQYNCRYYRDIDDLLSQEKASEVISVCTPNGLHCEHTIKSLKADKNVLCEKPMALTGSECEKMISAAANSHKRLFIVKQNRYNPPIMELKQMINQEILGKIFNVQLNCFWNRNDLYYQESDWKGTKKLDGGVLYTQFSHFLDLLLWLIGDIKKLQVYRKNFLHQGMIEFEDTGVIALEFDTGAIGTINYTINAYQNNMEGSITVFGEYGTVKVGGQYLNIIEYQNIKNYQMKSERVLNKANEYGFYQGSMSNHDKVYQNIIDVLHGRETIATNAIEGMKVVRIIEHIYEKSELE
jgi:predicted dehydrogenase